VDGANRTMTAMHSLDDFEAAVRRSHERPVGIFKHSLTCGRSAAALREVEAFLAHDPSADVSIVAVQTAAGVSREIAARFGVRHESPQALVISRGAVAWHASHSRVTRQNLAAAFAADIGRGGGDPL
jgi:bacillithiol system protein YtxJ